MYKAGKIADVEVKEYLFKALMTFFAPARKAYEELKANPNLVTDILKHGQERAMAVAAQTMRDARDAVGVTMKYSFFEYPKPVSGLSKQGQTPVTVDEFARVCNLNLGTTHEH